MRRLLLLRHAKAVPLSGGDDYDRALTARGRVEARQVGEWIADATVMPDLCLVSGAARTRETFELVAAALARPVAAQVDNALYDAPGQRVLGLVRALPGSVGAALVVGHNPGMGEVARLLTGEGASSERLRLGSHFPTAALAIIAFDRPDWSGLMPRTGRLECFVTPGDV
jgi:phosphohistidine phosphatase